MEEEETEAVSASDLKAQGNDAYQRQDFASAVDFWNKALRQHVEELSPGTNGKCLSLNDSRALERSLYLNLGQGYLKLGEPQRALRACVVVLQEDPLNTKALFRSAEAHLAMKQYEKSKELLAKVLEAEPDHAEAQRFSQRIDAVRRSEERKQKAAARRMFGACEGFADGRENASAPKLPESVAHHLEGMDPLLSRGIDIGTEAAQAARAREAAREARSFDGGASQTAEVADMDLEAFRAKVAAKTQRFNRYVDRSKKQRANAEHGLKLAWLRGGQDAAGLGGFTDGLRAEVGAIEAEDLAAAQARARAEEEAEQENEASVQEVAEDKAEIEGDELVPSAMEEMD